MSPRGVHRKSRASDVLLPKLDAKEGDLFIHCHGPKCRDSRVKTSNACNCRPCPNCDAVNGAIEKAAVLPHCGSVLCEARLRPATGPTYPSCACPCPICEHVANVAGYSRPDGTRGADPAPPLAESGRVQIQHPCGGLDNACGATGPCSHHPMKGASTEVLGDVVDDVGDIDFGEDASLEDDIGDLELEETADDPVVYEFENGTRVAGVPGTPVLEPVVVTAAAAAAGASPEHRLRVLVEETFPAAPVLTGSKCALARNCLYWLREDVPRQAEETSEKAANGTLGHTYGEEYARGTMTPAREAELVAQVRPAKDQDAFEVSLVHVRRWLDEHKGAFRWAEVPVAWDPETGLAVDLGPYLKAFGVDTHRAYADGKVWSRLREEALLGPLAIPATLDLVRFEGGEVLVYDWCWGRTDKRYQLALGALALREIHAVEKVTGVALYVDEEGVREVTYRFTAVELDELAKEFLALRRAAPDSRPLPGLHCVHDYCPARAECPVTQGAAEMVLDPQAPSEAVVVVKADGEVLHATMRFTPTITTDAEAAWILPRVKLLEDACERTLDALKLYVQTKSPKGYVATSPGKCWRPTMKKGSLKFSRPHAENLLRVLGATDEQISGCWQLGVSTPSFRETNIPAELPKAVRR